MTIGQQIPAWSLKVWWCLWNQLLPSSPANYLHFGFSTSIKKRNFNTNFIRWFLPNWGTFPVDRSYENLGMLTNNDKMMTSCAWLCFRLWIRSHPDSRVFVNSLNKWVTSSKDEIMKIVWILHTYRPRSIETVTNLSELDWKSNFELWTYDTYQ